jgi:hypothetical protein
MPYNAVGDGRYAIVNNISPRSDPLGRRAGGIPVTYHLLFLINDLLNCSNRMFSGYWYIDGDHTGTNNADWQCSSGCYTLLGYMLMVMPTM